MKNDKYNQKLDRRKRKLRSPINLDEKVLVLVKRLKKKDVPEIFTNLLQTIYRFLIEFKFLLFIKELS